jgi:ribose transport system substrate-binding protein
MSDLGDRRKSPPARMAGKWRLTVAALFMFVVIALALTACGGGSSSSSGGETSAAESEPAESETTAAEDEEAGGGSSSALVEEAKELVTELESTTTKWNGPKTGPKASPGKSIVFVTCTSTTPVCVEAGEAVEEVAPKLGWKVTVVSGNKGTQQEVTEAWNQALALKPDGIINAATDATANKKSLMEAEGLGIPVVGILSTAKPGDASKVHEFANVSQDPAEIGKAETMYAIAESNGEAKVAIDGVAGYEISKEKTDVMQKILGECEGCEELAYNGADLSSFETDTPQLISGWVSKFGPEFWVLTVADALVTPMVTPLRQGQVPPDGVQIVGSDGSPEAYERIRNGEYQVASIPQSPEQLAYQAVDELNRAFNNEKPTGFAQPLHLVTENNVEENGGKENKYSGTEGFQEQYEAIWKGK